MATKARDSSKDFNTLSGATEHTAPTGLWSNGTTLWVVNGNDGKIYAYNRATKARDSSKDINTLSAAGNTRPRGLWSNGTTMWVGDRDDDKIYAYHYHTR